MGEAPWQHIHIDFAGAFGGRMFQVAVDAHSKWPEVHVMDSTTLSKTIQVLRSLFSQYDIPECLVNDNGLQFASDEFDSFLKANGVKREFCPIPLCHKWSGGKYSVKYSSSL